MNETSINLDYQHERIKRFEDRVNKQWGDSIERAVKAILPQLLASEIEERQRKIKEVVRGHHARLRKIESAIEEIKGDVESIRKDVAAKQTKLDAYVTLAKDVARKLRSQVESEEIGIDDS